VNSDEPVSTSSEYALIPCGADYDQWDCSVRPADGRRRAVARAVGVESALLPIDVRSWRNVAMTASVRQ